jgi:hypothetical protein
MTFPIALIKLISEYVSTPIQLVEHELKTKGLPVLCFNYRRQKFYFDKITSTVKTPSTIDIPTVSEPEFIKIMRMKVEKTKRMHVMLRANLMEFHLLKV